MKQIASLTASRQKGAVLIVALIMLLLLTIIGVAGMQDTNLQEKMAGNLRDHNLALQAAEAGLRHAEQVSKGNYTTLAALADNAKTTAVTYTDFTGTVHTKPSYTFTKLPHPGPLELADLAGLGGNSLAAGEATILDFILIRVESTGTGVSPDSTVKLRSLYFVEE